ncbi:MAG: hypothetical protein GXO60_07205 [Epsilonproteobacteria bacterium]|nr:hypothetical protein [Campylobacterota bacterium]
MERRGNVLLRKYRVWLSMGYYDGYVDIFATNTNEAIYRAKQELKKTTFQDYLISDMKHYKVEILSE